MSGKVQDTITNRAL